MFELAGIQAALIDLGIDAWLLGDFRGSNLLARRVLQMEAMPIASRRFYYFIPARGEPTRVVHRIETGSLDHLPGAKRVYLRWQELEEALVELVRGKKVAMEYAPRVSNPYVARTDAGLVELARAAGAEVVSSGDLIQLFEAVWDDEQWQMHLEAACHTSSAFERAFTFIAEGVRRRGGVRESEVQKLIMDHFAEHKMTTYSPPIVGVGSHSGDPHYETTPETDTVMAEGDFVLVDLWAKLDRPRGVYSDLTWVAFVGKTVPPRYKEVFDVVAAARDAGIQCVRQAFAEKRPLRGWEVDRATRAVIDRAGYGQYFVHRTGHSIGQETHGNGANMDDLETHDERLVLPRTCFSIEPGIYLPEFGVRSEVNVFVDAASRVHVTGPAPQTEVVPLLARY